MACDRRTAGLLACVSLPAFPLQLQLLERPQWRRHPCAIIDCDKPQGRLLWVNEKARQQRILPGMRYAAALALDRDLRAAEVSEARTGQAIERLTAEVLTGFSPRVEASETEPGVFWLDLAGMERLFPDLETWAAGLVQRLDEEGFVCRLVVGWSRFHCYALAKAHPPTQWSGLTCPDVTGAASENVGAGVHPPPAPGGAQGPSPTRVEATTVDIPTREEASPLPYGTRTNATDVGAGPTTHNLQLGSAGGSHNPQPTTHNRAGGGAFLCRSPSQEQRLAAKVPLARLGLDPAVRDAFEDLGVTTLGEFIQLPREGIERRFGPEVRDLHQQACGERQPPLEAEELEVEVGERAFIEESIRELPRLMTWIELLLVSSLETLAKRGELAFCLTLELSLENGDPIREDLRPAEPTNEHKQWLELLGLRLSSTHLSEGVQEIVLTLAGKRAQTGQMELFAAQPLRDLTAANRALARVRAELGDAAIRRAEIRNGHLPEAQFAWRPFKRLVEAQPARIAEARMVRRLFARPRKLPPRPRQEPDGWLLRGLTDSPVDKVRGPFVIAGGWWRKPVHREYHYAETRDGELLWTYYDRLRRRWYLQGRIE